MKRIGVLHGVNFNVLERRSSEHYGKLSLSELEWQIERAAHERGLTVSCFQTNHEGDYVEEIHHAENYADGLILNPGAWTHYAWAIRDAVELTGLTCAEVHLSDLTARERFRQQSVLAGICALSISGEGVAGYVRALDELKVILGD